MQRLGAPAPSVPAPSPPGAGPALSAAPGMEAVGQPGACAAGREGTARPDGWDQPWPQPCSGPVTLSRWDSASSTADPLY